MRVGFDDKVYQPLLLHPSLTVAVHQMLKENMSAHTLFHKDFPSPPMRESIQHLADLCQQNQRGLVLAESCTGGALGFCFSSMPGNSAWFLGGVTCYHNGMKVRLLGVSKQLIERHGVVSQPVVEAMAVGLKRSFPRALCFSLTGWLDNLPERDPSSGLFVHHPTPMTESTFPEDKNTRVLGGQKTILANNIWLAASASGIASGTEPDIPSESTQSHHIQLAEQGLTRAQLQIEVCRESIEFLIRYLSGLSCPRSGQ